MNPFEKHFTKLLVTEADEPTVQATADPTMDPTADQEAWKNSLEKDTDPTAFDTAGNPEFSVVNQNIDLVREWVRRIEEFRHFINGLGGDSMNAQINKLDRAGSVFKGLVRSEENRVIRIAEDLAGLGEVFKAYMIGAEKKVRDMKEH